MAELKTKDYSYILIASILTFIVALLIILFPIRFLWNSNQDLFKEVKEKRKELSYLEDKEGKLEKLEDRKEELEVQKDKVLNALPEEKDQARILTQVEYIAATAGFNAKENKDQSSESSAPLETPEGTVSKTPLGVTEVPLEISSEGTYSALKTFLENIETAIRIINVGSMDISLKEEGTNTLQITLKAKAFFKTLGGQ